MAQAKWFGQPLLQTGLAQPASAALDTAGKPISWKGSLPHRDNLFHVRFVSWIHSMFFFPTSIVWFTVFPKQGACYLHGVCWQHGAWWWQVLGCVDLYRIVFRTSSDMFRKLFQTSWRRGKQNSAVGLINGVDVNPWNPWVYDETRTSNISMAFV